jgi:hypothetical protein
MFTSRNVRSRYDEKKMTAMHALLYFVDAERRSRPQVDDQTDGQL